VSIIAVAGKGGTGKTTISALIIRALLKRGIKPILAIDADPNANLAESLGIQHEESIGSVLSDFLRGRDSLPAGMTKQAYLEMKLHQILHEGRDIDLLVMGVPEGPGCYCAANAILRNYFERLAGNYQFVVVDNEAGMEHFSRKTAAAIDILILCTAYSLKGLRTASLLSGMADQLGITIARRYLLVNRAPERLSHAFQDAVRATGIPLLGAIPNDPSIEEAELAGRSILGLPDDVPAVRRAAELAQRIT